MSMIMLLESVASTDNPIRALPPKSPPAGFTLRIFDPELVEDETNETTGSPCTKEEACCNNSISLEKAWHGLHYLLTGQVWSGNGLRGFLVEGGRECGGESEYGPPRIFDPAEVKSISQILQEISPDELWSQYEAQRFTQQGIYPDIWDEPEEDLREEYIDYFESLKAFVSTAAQSGHSLQISLV